MTVGQTVKTWSVMETVLSVTGLVVVLILGSSSSRAPSRLACVR
jgi:H+/gluconate symporter-like permease